MVQRRTGMDDSAGIVARPDTRSRVDKMLGQPAPLVLYSTNTWLAYAINQNYYGGEHYVWCTPHFDVSLLPSITYTVPPSSSPADIYRGLSADIEGRDRHSARIATNRAGILRGAEAKVSEGKISDEERDEISSMLADAELPDFRPLIYVIPVPLVLDRLSAAPASRRAHVMSKEFVITHLPHDCFDLVSLHGV